jgi:hypothetical protein
MTSKVYYCESIQKACEKYLEAKENKRKDNLEKWISKYSTYTEGWGTFKQTWERCRASTVEFLDKELGDNSAGWQYYFECKHITEHEETVKKILNMSNSKGSNNKITIDLEHFDLIKNYYED